ncbi:MAG TPA: sugar ABC transporter substrate-binding protein [Solirubrobacterales bacterium]|jgi:ABC-type sugar transport system substrate-binding protein
MAFLCLAVLFLSACGGGGDSSSSSAESTTTEAAETTAGGGEEGGAIDGEGKKIAFLGFGFGNALSDAATKAAREEGSKLNVSVQAFDGKFDPGNQVAQCQDAVASGQFSAIVVSAIVGPMLVPCAAQAKEAGIPVIAWGDAIGTSSTSKTPTEPGVVANVFTPISLLFSGVGAAITSACEGIEPCRIVNLNALELLPDVSKVLKEELEQLESENPQIEVVEEPEAGLEVSTGQAAMQDILAKGTEFNVVISPGTQAMAGALIALKSAGKTLSATGEGIRVLASGATTQQMEGVESGELWGAMITLPVTEGRTSIEVATKAALGMSFPKSTLAYEVEGLPTILSTENKSEWSGFKGQWSE